MKWGVYMSKKYKRRWGDRYDGRKCRNIPALFYVIPHIMRSRLDSQIFFEETIDLEELEKFVRQKRKDEIPNFATLHLIIAAALRMFAEKPGLNRFISGKRIYARNTYRVSLAVKQGMNADAEETTITPEFEATDSLADITKKINDEILAVKNIDDDKNATSALVKVLKFVPCWLVNFIVASARFLDKRGLLPKLIYKASPFHSSFFITDVGSIGINSIYHHLYEFGTTSVFIALGKKQTAIISNPDGTLSKKKTITIKFVVDERICDGFYYASALKCFMRYIKKPELLEEPLKEFSEDPWL